MHFVLLPLLKKRRGVSGAYKKDFRSFQNFGSLAFTSTGSTDLSFDIFVFFLLEFL